VHQVIGGGPMPPYIRRPHDDVLDALMDPETTASRLVVVRGGSSTGKTRAAWEAVTRGRLARWPLAYPQGEADLAALLGDGIPAGTVLWLGELRQYTGGQDNGSAVLGRLAELLDSSRGVIVVTTVWPRHWQDYADGARARSATGPSADGITGRLLERLPVLTGCEPAGIDPARGGVVDVPDEFTRD
jgi:hypothetical protein